MGYTWGWEKDGTPHPTQGQVPTTASFPYSPEKQQSPAVDLENMPMTLRVGDLSLSLSVASMDIMFSPSAPQQGAGLSGTPASLGGPNSPFSFLWTEESPGQTLPVSSAFSAHLVVWDELEKLTRKR